MPGPVSICGRDSRGLARPSPRGKRFLNVSSIGSCTMNRAKTSFASRERLPAYRTRDPKGSAVARSSGLHCLRLRGLSALAPRGRSEAAGTSPCSVSSRLGDCYLGPLLCRVRLRPEVVASTRVNGFAILVAAKASTSCLSGLHHLRLAGFKTLAPQNPPEAFDASPCETSSRRGAGPARRKSHPRSSVNDFIIKQMPS